MIISSFLLSSFIYNWMKNHNSLILWTAEKEKEMEIKKKAEKEKEEKGRRMKKIHFLPLYIKKLCIKMRKREASYLFYL